MNYHIIPQDKFFCAYIEDVYKLHQEDNNVFLVRGNRGDTNLLNTERPIKYIGSNRESIIDRLRYIKPQDRLIVSWYDIFIGECILESKITCSVYVYLMGGDFYNDPSGYHNWWLYDSCTKRIVNKLYSPAVNFKRRPHNWHKIVDEVKSKISYRRNLVDDYNRKQKTVARIDYIITSAYNDYEINMVRHLYPTFRAKYMHGSFDQNFDLVKDIPFVKTYSGHQPLRVLLGNSADPSNNHIDACEFLLKVLPKDAIFNCPLSYGDTTYSVSFQQWAKNHLQSKFHPILDFMDREEYIKFLNSMDIVVMYHNRQQAFGNIITSLCLGKPVFIKKKSPVYPMLKSLGIPSIYSTDMMRKGDLNQICKMAFINRALTLSIIQQYYSEEVRLNDLQRIICGELCSGRKD